MTHQKRTVAIHDISGVGKCSLTVALPILSALGIETNCLPTALLSTHTGEFKGYTFLDLTSEMNKITEHWKTLNLKVDAVYSGYLGNSRQVDTVIDFIDYFKTPETVIAVDPVMGDVGKYYNGIDGKFAVGMKKLCKKADIILPNITEACFISGREYKSGPYSADYIKTLCRKLAETGCGNVVITGVYFDDKSIGAASYNGTTNEFSLAFSEKIEGYYHGTGDVFASSLIGAYLNGKTLSESTQIAVDFTKDCVVRTHDAGTETKYGVNFEAEIPKLIYNVFGNLNF